MCFTSEVPSTKYVIIRMARGGQRVDILQEVLGAARRVALI
jgi:hypothetical protein